MNGNLNAALVLLDRALEEIENGFVRCEICGEQEDTKDLDFFCNIKAAKDELLLMVDKSKPSPVYVVNDDGEDNANGGKRADAE